MINVVNKVLLDAILLPISKLLGDLCEYIYNPNLKGAIVNIESIEKELHMPHEYSQYSS